MKCMTSTESRTTRRKTPLIKERRRYKTSQDFPQLFTPKWIWIVSNSFHSSYHTSPHKKWWKNDKAWWCRDSSVANNVNFWHDKKSTLQEEKRCKIEVCRIVVQYFSIELASLINTQYYSVLKWALKDCLISRKLVEMKPHHLWW